jgi:hypothetical protein
MMRLLYNTLGHKLRFPFQQYNCWNNQGLLKVKKIPNANNAIERIPQILLGHSRHSPIRGIRDEKICDFKKAVLEQQKRYKCWCNRWAQAREAPNCDETATINPAFFDLPVHE